MEEILEVGGYFKAVEMGFFVDSGMYPERNGDGIARQINGGIGAGTVVERDKDYMAPVCEHFGYNNLPEGITKACDLIDGCTFCKPEKIIFIDELDENDNVNRRLKETETLRHSNEIKPEVEWCGDGIVSTTIFLPVEERVAEFAAMEIGKKMGLEDVVVIHKQVMQPAEGTLVEIKGRVPFTIDISKLEIPKKPEILSDEEIRKDIERKPMKVVAATVGEDEHSVGLREVIDIKHGGIEKYGIECLYLGTSCPVEKLVDAAIEFNADAILASTIITHNDVHIKNMKKIHELCIEKGVRDRLIVCAGGTQVTDEIAKSAGMDAGFGRGTKGNDVASFLVKRRREMENYEG
ncbi:OAM dimerization domain-containing protein [Caloramator sp. mosi_1]|uniref:OAM dimerization domain-containing protein n=1 Tax=Caloramator sp. mosi_1 TaxID=3023090 RepID=UPI003081A7F2